jgi:hypothetical protein
VSTVPDEWGVPPQRAIEASNNIQTLIARRADLRLCVVGVNTIPFELYEDAVLKRQSTRGSRLFVKERYPGFYPSLPSFVTGRYEQQRGALPS